MILSNYTFFKAISHPVEHLLLQGVLIYHRVTHK